MDYLRASHGEFVCAAAEAGWAAGELRTPVSSWVDLEFAKLELTGSRDVSAYCRRLSNLGFAGLNRVLDAGCGLGQWSIALELLGTTSVGIDMRHDRLTDAFRLSSIDRATTPRPVRGDIAQLPFADESFDAVFCYGTLMFADIDHALSEMNRVLVGGGKIYVNVSSFGWCLRQILFSKHSRLGSVLMLIRTLRRKSSGVYISKRGLLKRLVNAGFEMNSVACEGELGASNRGESFYQKHFIGLPCVLEAMAFKPTRKSIRE